MEDDGVPFEKPVGLVARQEELEETRKDVYVLHSIPPNSDSRWNSDGAPKIT
jgi:hypothetical protein